MQMVFQDAAGSFHPRRSLAESLEAHMRILRPQDGKEMRQQELGRLLAAVGIDPSIAVRRPHAVSGGECQRMAIARALSVQPEILLCDEITSALDVSTQAQVLEVLKSIHCKTQAAILFVTHDLALAGSFCDTIMVLKNGACVEYGETGQVFGSPQQEYTRRLLSFILAPDQCLAERRCKAGSNPDRGPDSNPAR